MPERFFCAFGKTADPLKNHPGIFFTRNFGDKAIAWALKVSQTIYTMKILRKINLYFIRTNIWISGFTIYINHPHFGWGISILSVTSGVTEYCFLHLTWMLPNGAERSKVRFRGDFLFLRNWSMDTLFDYNEAVMYGARLSKSSTIKHKLLKMMYKIFN